MHTVSFSPTWFLWHSSRCKHCSRGSQVPVCLSIMEVILLSYTKRNWKLTKYLIYELPSMVLIQLFYTSPNSRNTSKRHLFIKWWVGGEKTHCLLHCSVQFSSVQSVVSNSLQPRESQHARPPCPSPTPGFHPNPCPVSHGSQSTISSSVIPFSSCPQSFPASGSFWVNWHFASGGQSWSFSFSISPSNDYWGLISFRIDWFDLLAVRGTLKSLLQHHNSKASLPFSTN